MKTVTAKWAFDNKETINLIDVRTPAEYQVRGLKEAKNIPLRGLIMNADLFLEKGKTYYLMCASGGRSAMAAIELEKQGYDVANVEGGIAQM